MDGAADRAAELAAQSVQGLGGQEMAIFLTEDSKVIVQGMTGSEGQKHTQRMLAPGPQIVGGGTPGKGGKSVWFEGHTVPVFGSCADAVKATGADVSVLFVPPKFT